MGSGRTILTGNNTYTGGTTICTCSTLQLGTSVTSGSILGAVTNEGIFDIVNADTSGITTVTNKASAFTIFRNSTDAGTMTIDNQSFGSVEFRQTSSAANAMINNNMSASTTFFNSSTAGNATINNFDGPGFIRRSRIQYAQQSRYGDHQQCGAQFCRVQRPDLA